jgi:hypothetical protein
MEVREVDLFGMDVNLWAAGAALVEAIIVAAAAAFAFGQVREARLTREDQSRPFVILDFEISRPPFIHLVVKNIGKSIARRVRIQTDPPLASSLDGKPQWEPIAKLRLFSEEIPSIAPDREIWMFFDSFKDRAQGQFDDLYRVTVTYEGERGRSYADEMVLDLSIYRNISVIDQHTIHDVHKQLKKIADSVDRWGAGVGHGSGLLVVTRDDKREDHARAVRRFRARSDASFAPRESSEPRAQWELRRLRQRLARRLAVLSDRVDPEE